MIVVADASPLQYLVRIKAINVLLPLYHRVLIPRCVIRELQRPKTPAALRAWIAHLPAWCQVRTDPPADHTLAFLDAGERAAIALALAVQADRLLIDEYEGRREAEHRGVPVTGTLGVLGVAHRAGLLDFETALAELRRTNFYISDTVVDGLRRQLASAKDDS